MGEQGSQLPAESGDAANTPAAAAEPMTPGELAEPGEAPRVPGWGEPPGEAGHGRAAVPGRGDSAPCTSAETDTVASVERSEAAGQHHTAGLWERG